MKQVPEWTNEEFELLVRNDSLSDEELSKSIPRRTIGAIQFVRSGIHEFHRKGDSPLLSKMIKNYLTKSVTVLVCPICGVRIQSK
jgi:hypothetical protein